MLNYVLGRLVVLLFILVVYYFATKDKSQPSPPQSGTVKPKAPLPKFKYITVKYPEKNGVTYALGGVYNEAIVPYSKTYWGDGFNLDKSKCVYYVGNKDNNYRGCGTDKTKCNIANTCPTLEYVPDSDYYYIKTNNNYWACNKDGKCMPDSTGKLNRIILKDDKMVSNNNPVCITDDYYLSNVKNEKADRCVFDLE